MEWKTVAKTSEFVEGKPRAFIVDETPIMVTKVKDAFYAIDAICTHRAAYLPEPYGKVEGQCIICPIHSAGFDLTTGELVRRISPEKTPNGIVPNLKAHDTKVEGGEVLVFLRK